MGAEAQLATSVGCSLQLESALFKVEEAKRVYLSDGLAGRQTG